MKTNPPPVSVYKADGDWYWTCRIPHCHKVGSASRQLDAYTASIRHVDGHRQFGIRPR